MPNIPTTPDGAGAAAGRGIPVNDTSTEGLPQLAPLAAAPSDLGGDLIVEVELSTPAQAAGLHAGPARDAMRLADAPGHIVDLHDVLNRYGMKATRPVFSEARMSRDDARRSQDRARSGAAAAAPADASLAPLSHFVRLHFPPGTPANEVTRSLLDLEAVKKAVVVPGAAPPAAVLQPEPVPDPLVGSASPVVDAQTGLETQWYLHRLKIVPAWSRSQGADVVIADIDWGFRITHDDLHEGIERTFNAVDHGADVTQGPAVNHGTAVLSIAGARENGMGMQGVAPRATLWAIQADSGPGPALSHEAWAEALEFVAQEDSGGRRKVIILEVQTNPVLGNYEQIPSVHRAVRSAIAAGCIVCVAAGNGDRRADLDDQGTPFEPTGSILVGATLFDPHGNRRAGFSNFGPTVTVCAPGDPDHDLSCTAASDTSYRNRFGGTSGATPKVAGVAALMLAANPALSHDEVREILVQTGSAVVSDSGKPVGPLVDALAAVQEAQARTGRPVPPPLAGPRVVAAPPQVGAAAADTVADDAVKQLQLQLAVVTTQTQLLAGQQQLLGAQMVAQIGRQVGEASNDKKLADALRDAVLARSGLARAGASAEFAQLQGIKEGLAGLAVPGKEGSLSITKGVDGTLSLHSKKNLLVCLGKGAVRVAAALSEHPGRYVLADQQAWQTAQRSTFARERLVQQFHRLDAAIHAWQAAESAAAPFVLPALPAALAAVQTVPFALNVLSDAGKFFRADRTISLFEQKDEAQAHLHDFLEVECNKHSGVELSRIDRPDPTMVQVAWALLEDIEQLRRQHDLGQALLARDGPAGQASTIDPAATSDLAGAVAAAGSLLDGIDPDKSPEAFWSLVAGLRLQSLMDGRGLLEVSVQGQVERIQEKRVWRSDQLVDAGDAQITYRLSDARGQRLDGGTLLISSSPFTDSSAGKAHVWSTH
ncbi:S8 family peptidase [Piscinibacter terrae]|uniref:Peptidase S8/S53 domain-containing protein n=1 Tax=Piscinibacter terrae TaxID=2496871 RepID=A0A3N7HXL3_9BURK|nr:S8 family serine peptidase [Albitalea terrae]RQP25801.1 hypothetical protein DZC73_01670 [Albitalea terrae]